MPIDRFGDRYGAGWSFQEEEWLSAVMQMGNQKHHIEELADMTGRTVCAIINRIQLRLNDTRMSRKQFSEHVMKDSALTMTAEEFAQAVGQPLETILRRAKAAGIEMRREGDLPVTKTLIASYDYLEDGRVIEHHFAVAKDVPRASIASPRSPVVSMGFWNPFKR